MVSEIDLRFTDNEISPWGGLSVMFKMLERCGMDEALSSCPLPQQGSNRGYSPRQLIYGLFAGVWCGASCFDQLEIVRHDGCLRRILGWELGAGHRAYIRYFDKFTQADNQRVFDHLYGWFFKNLQFDNYTLDFDSTVEQRCGEQEGTAKGYNPKRPGRQSHHPLLAFIGRQYVIPIGSRRFKIDLVFYHAILKCYVLIDLKRAEIKHGDIGQMNLYLNYFKNEVCQPDDNPPIGIILGAKKDEILMEYALQGIDNQLFAARYQLYLPNREELQAQLDQLLEK